jgi:hypothetical protein
MPRLRDRAFSDTKRSLESGGFWSVSLIISAPIAVLVGAALPEGTVWERAIGGLGAGALTLLVLVLMWFAWNLSQAGNRLTLDAYSERYNVLQQELTAAQSQIPIEPTDDEIVAALSATTKQQMVARSQDLLSGKAGAPWFDKSTNAQMIEYQLIEIRHVMSQTRPGWGSVANAMIVLTPTGSRVLQLLLAGKG